MGIPDEVRAVCQHQSDNSALMGKAEEWVNKPESGCKEIIITVKKLIKDKKQPPDCKLNALKVDCRQLHHYCMLNANINYLKFAEKKIMQRLTILAAYKKEVLQIVRGADIFGATDESGRQLGVEFLSTLLNCIRTWASLYGMRPDGTQSAFLKAYSQLLNQQVVFPQPVEPVGPPPAQPSRPVLPPHPPTPRPAPLDRALTNLEIEECSNSQQILRELLASPDDNEEMITQLSTNLKQFLPKVEKEMGVQLSQPNSDRARERLLNLNDAVLNTLSRYESWKQGKGRKHSAGERRNPAPHETSDDADLQRAIRESLNTAPPPLHRSSTDVSLLRREKEDTIHQLELELVNLKKEMTEFVKTSEVQKATCLQIAADTELRVATLTRKHTEEQEKYKAKIRAGVEAKAAQQKLADLQSELANVQRDVKEKEETLKRVMQAIGAASEENHQLKLRLQDDTEIQAPEVLAPMPPARLTIAIPSSPRNSALWPSIIQNERGLLFTDAEIEVGYMFRPEQPFTLYLYVGNKVQSRIENLCTSPVCCEGLTMQIDKEREEVPVESTARVIKAISIAVSEPFSDIPKLKLSYR